MRRKAKPKKAEEHKYRPNRERGDTRRTTAQLDIS